MGLIKPVERVFGKSGLWGGSLCIYEFTHTGPSRSGQATISVVCHPDDLVTVVYAHHEGAEASEWMEWKKDVECAWGRTVERTGFDAENCDEMNAITDIIADIVAKHYE